jgi:hypothetical protein
MAREPTLSLILGDTLPEVAPLGKGIVLDLLEHTFPGFIGGYRSSGDIGHRGISVIG